MLNYKIINLTCLYKKKSNELDLSENITYIQ